MIRNNLSSQGEIILDVLFTSYPLHFVKRMGNMFALVCIGGGIGLFAYHILLTRSLYGEILGLIDILFGLSMIIVVRCCRQKVILDNIQGLTMVNFLCILGSGDRPTILLTAIINIAIFVSISTYFALRASENSSSKAPTSPEIPREG